MQIRAIPNIIGTDLLCVKTVGYLSEGQIKR